MLALMPNIFYLYIVIVSFVDCLEFSKSNSGDTWNSWGNNNNEDHELNIKLPDDNIVGKQSNFRQCVKPWQKPLMTVATISKASRPVTCHPDFKPCSDPKSECQFSFSSFNYICCQDRDDMKPPECPKYYDTLRTLCGGINDASCPRSYKCLPSRFDPNVEICCKPNASLAYPEPDTSFRDNFIVPEHISVSPTTMINIEFKSFKLSMGQLISNDDIEDLFSVPPNVNSFEGDETKQYTILLFGYPRNAPSFVNQPNRATLYWLVNNLAPVNGTLYSSESKRSSLGRELFPYIKPLKDEKPYGIHIMVLLIFEQKNEMIKKSELRVNQSNHEFVVKQLLEDISNQIDTTPVAGNFYGFTSSPDEQT